MRGLFLECGVRFSLSNSFIVVKLVRSRRNSGEIFKSGRRTAWRCNVGGGVYRRKANIVSVLHSHVDDDDKIGSGKIKKKSAFGRVCIIDEFVR